VRNKNKLDFEKHAFKTAGGVSAGPDTPSLLFAAGERRRDRRAFFLSFFPLSCIDYIE
jgi:hypothetical protein